MILSELIPFLESIGARPKKGLSQNFLIDQNIVKKIALTAGVQPNDAILEIGPGPGALTKELLEKGANVFAIEKDSSLANQLSRFQTNDNRLTVFDADFLKFSLENLPSPLKAVANLPYHITTPILEKIFEAASQFSSVTFMVQKEVGDRMMAKAGSKEFSSLSIFVQFYAELDSSFKVSSNSFYPRPKVDSIVLRLNIVKPPLEKEDAALFFSIVRRAFQQRRKMISSSLQKMIPSAVLKETLGNLGYPNARPEDLSLQEWLKLFFLLKKDAVSAV
jgi:16S rRNA (adenine1518-N6/adenine1519-N6)-dimethyltransferase